MQNINLQFVDFEQGSQEWLKWRENGVGGSDVPILMGLGEKFKKSPYRLWLEKTGLEKALDISNLPQIRRGHQLEPVARDILAKHFNVAIQPLCIEDVDNAHRRVSLDGLADMVVDGKAVQIPFEIKAPGLNAFTSVVNEGVNSKEYIYYNWQVQYQIALTNAPFAYLAFYSECSGQPKMKVFKIERDDQQIADVLSAVDAFAECVSKKVQPDLDPDLDTLELDHTLSQTWSTDTTRLYELRKEQVELKAKLEAIKSEMSEINGRFESATKGFKKFKAGNVIVSRSMRQTTDWKELIKKEAPNIDDNVLSRYKKCGKAIVSVRIVDEQVEYSNSAFNTFAAIYGDNLIVTDSTQFNTI